MEPNNLFEALSSHDYEGMIRLYAANGIDALERNSTRRHREFSFSTGTFLRMNECFASI
jgi:hypothetical protein